MPIVLTASPNSDLIGDRLGGLDVSDAVPLLVWLPVVMLLAGLVVERRSLPRGGGEWWTLLAEISPELGLIGVTMVSAFAASNVLNTLGIGEQLAPCMERLEGVPQSVAALVVGLVVVIVAGPLNTTSTLAAVGPVAFAALLAADVPPYIAFAAIIVWASSEGCSPPGAAPLYVAAGIASINPVRIFVPVTLYYLVPSYLMGVLMVVGAIWIPG
ncbi:MULTISPECIES: TRAP transporter large permease subunit [unclassified Streptomyces]|uniref:TRAP transporter large permease subunit n=1 Tax=unclassified Streptomyces TaxID=2593676 RepID=UPI000823EDE2|nr:TRAP transporter large permease subunit [Streptomyces sp. AmelKG-E11A]SCK12164.1 TRAP-type C4-dicarboxylate transport system, large permease component [Streptomyces sp. AmelKG-E11A]